MRLRIFNKIKYKGELPEDCWIYEENLYTNDYSRYYKEKIHTYNNPKHILPTVTDDDKAVLDYLGLPNEDIIISLFDKFVILWQYWDPRFLEFEEKTAPVYYRTPKGTYKYTGNTFTGLVVTEESVIAARKLTDTVNDMIVKYKEFLYAKRILSSQNNYGAVAITFGSSSFLYSDIIEWNVGNEEKDVEAIKTFVFPVINSNRWVNIVAFFNLTEIQRNNYSLPVIELPEELHKFAGVIVGKEHWRLNSWLKDLSNYVDIKGIQAVKYRV